MPPQPRPPIQDLRDRIRQLEGGGCRTTRVLPFGHPAIDARLPGGGLVLGAVHEVAAGGATGVAHTAAASLFVAGILARMTGPVLWCLRASDLFAPALSQVGLDPNRVIYAEAADERALPLLVEEGLRHRVLGAVVGELATLPMVASRRLQLAAEHSGVTAIILRRWRRLAVEDNEPTAAVSRWRVTAQPSSPLPAPGIGRMRWRVELVRCRGSVGDVWDLEGCDETGCLGLPADVADGSAMHQTGSHPELLRGATLRQRA